MQRPKSKPALETITIAEKLLSETFGHPVYLGDAEDLGGGKLAQVYRFNVLDAPSDAPASVIVKQVRSTAEVIYAPDSAREPAWTFFNDWASLKFLSSNTDGDSLSPKFLAGDRATGLFVMEDLGTGMRLDHFLLGHDPLAAENALIEYAALHGRLHALTFGKQKNFVRIRKSLGPHVEESGYYTYDWLAPAFYKTTELLGIAPMRGVDAELALLKQSLLYPGPFLTYTQGDTCPDNCLFVNSIWRLLDFEGGMFDAALKEGVYGRMHFPTCWCVYRMPEYIPLRMEAAYRAELAKGCPAASDDTLFYHAVVEACIYWMLAWEGMHMFSLAARLETDRYLVAATDRQRLLMRFEDAAQATEAFGHLEAIGTTARAIATKLRTLWPEADAVPYYPAFRKEAETCSD